jgi:hypothetical protein
MARSSRRPIDNLSMHRATLERQQVWIYLTAIGLGLGVGSAAPALAPWPEILLWPTLMLLLYATFVQVPLLHVREAFGDRRFVAAVLIGNFVLLPLVAWVLVSWLPADPVLIVGVLLVLLVPCTDWFITFSQLGGGNVPRAIAVTPLNLLLQLVLLPPWLWLIAGTEQLPTLAFADLAGRLVQSAVDVAQGVLDAGLATLQAHALFVFGCGQGHVTELWPGTNAAMPFKPITSRLLANPRTNADWHAASRNSASPADARTTPRTRRGARRRGRPVPAATRDPRAAAAGPTRSRPR